MGKGYFGKFFAIALKKERERVCVCMREVEGLIGRMKEMVALKQMAQRKLRSIHSTGSFRREISSLLTERIMATQLEAHCPPPLFLFTSHALVFLLTLKFYYRDGCYYTASMYISWTYFSRMNHPSLLLVLSKPSQFNF
jgi:hypothetical protein